MGTSTESLQGGTGSEGTSAESTRRDRDLVRVYRPGQGFSIPSDLRDAPSTDSQASLTGVCGCGGGRPECEASAGSFLWSAKPAPEREPRAWRGGRRPAAENAQHRLTDMENPQTQTEMLTGHEDR